MFNREADMTAIASRWMESAGLVVKREFASPWGICDLVGVEFDGDAVEKRLGFRQTQPLGSISRAEILRRIPDSTTGRSVSIYDLAKSLGNWCSRQQLTSEVERLARDRFVISDANGQLRRQDGWRPLQKRIVAIELKLVRIDEVLRQAVNNLGFADESYAALPEPVALRLTQQSARWVEIEESGIGIIGVAAEQCTVQIPARPNKLAAGSALQMYCVDKFWRRKC